MQSAVIGVCWILSLLPNITRASYLHHHSNHGVCVAVEEPERVVALEAEPVAVSCPLLARQMEDDDLTPERGYTFHIVRSNHGGHTHFARGGRLRQEGRSLWLLPSHPSDSGTYTCVVRNATFCVKSSVSVSVYPSEGADMEMISVLVPEVTPGHNVIVPCVTEHLNVTHRPAWYKGRSAAALPVGKGRYLWRWGGALLIQHFSSSDSGFYVCRVTVSVFGALYTVTRFSRVHTTGEAAPTFQSASTHTPDNASPHIVSPTNSSVFKSHLGSSLVMRCTVAMGSQSASSIQVTWLVGSQSVERSSLAPRAFQKERVTGGHVEADLVILEVREEDSWAELRCVSQTSTGRQEVFVQIEMAEDAHVWWVVCVFCVSCLVCVVCVFLFHLRPRPPAHTHKHYFLTRQDSVF